MGLLETGIGVLVDDVALPGESAPIPPDFI
jgi:hypothetical protein